MSERVLNLNEVPLVEAVAHDGEGRILFRRVLDAGAFEGPWNFVDYAVLPPGTAIGRHTHGDNEELYLVLEGEGILHLDGRELRVRPGARGRTGHPGARGSRQVPEPVKRGRRYMPGLDGLRAIAVLAVIAYHLGIGWMPGGLLGVGVFFTLSGYLITDLLLAQVDAGGIKLGSFWLARARRLLPALLVMLIVVMAWVTMIGPHQPAGIEPAEAAAWAATLRVVLNLDEVIVRE